ncbi:MAG: hypothetical protein ACWA5R_02845 [bacterium]
MLKFKLVLLSLFLSSPLFAQERHIHINGEHLSAEEIAIMDQAFSTRTPDGYYWINFNNGNWGYEGNDQIMGNIMPQQANEQGYQQGSGQGGSQEEIYNWGNGGYVQGEKCSYASVGGTTVRLCD